MRFAIAVCVALFAGAPHIRDNLVSFTVEVDGNIITPGIEQKSLRASMPREG